MNNKKLVYLILIIISIIIIDQIVKLLIVNYLYSSSITIINGVLNLTYIENTGGAYGIGNGNTAIFIIVNVLIITLITVFIFIRKNNISTTMLFGLGLIEAGGIGNLLDRIIRGFVVDYIDINPLIKFPVFNIADICIVLGCIIVIANIIKKIR